MANPKDPRQQSRERRSGDDLNFAVQTRERSQRKQQYEVAPEPPAKQTPKQAGRTRPAIPLVPPDMPNDPSPQAKAVPNYPGQVMNESHRRKESGRLGQPLPIPQPPKPAVSKSAAASSIRSSATAPMPAASRSVAPSRPSTQPAARSMPHPLARELEEADRRAYHESATRSVARSRVAEQLEEIYEVYYVPTFGPHQALIACVIASVALAWALFSTPLGAPLGLVPQSLTWSEWAAQTIQSVTAGAPSPAKQLDTSKYMQPLSAPIGETSIMGKPTITAAQIDEILASYGSPATGSGQAFYDIGLEYGIDPAYALAFFIHESSAGTNQGWAGIKADGTTTHNIGNIICAGYPTCYNRFRDYGSWSEGIADWYKLIAVEYIQGRGTSTIEQIIPIYAPSFENDVPGYVNAVNTLVNNWRQGLR